MDAKAQGTRLKGLHRGAEFEMRVRVPPNCLAAHVLSKPTIFISNKVRLDVCFRRFDRVDGASSTLWSLEKCRVTSCDAKLTLQSSSRVSLISPEVDTRFVCPREFGRPVTWVLPSFHGEPVKRNLSDTVLRNPCDATGVFSERLVFGIPEIQILVPFI
jgi:hypothetical protein